VSLLVYLLVFCFVFASRTIHTLRVSFLNPYF
jgi:hypothetical protein